MRIEWLSPKELLAHEDVDPNMVEAVALQLRVRNRLIPPVVDQDTLTIIDGHHRVKASIKLGLKKVPLVLIPYRRAEVKVGKWYREFSKPALVEEIFSTIDSNGEFCAKFRSSSLCASSIYTLYWRLYALEDLLKYLGVRVAKRSQYEHGNNALDPPELSKDDVIDYARRGLLFPPKTTHHSYSFNIPRDEIDL
jgi:hypothetical protein